jgi:hypothetical protein
MLNELTIATAAVSARREGAAYRLDFSDGTSREATQAEVLDAAKAAILPRIRAERERRQLADGFPVTLPGLGTVRFHSDAHSRSQHAGLYAAATLALMQGGTAASPVLDPQTGQQVQWRTMGGALVPLSVGVLLTLLQASMAREGAVHAAADAHIAAVEAMTDAEAVLAYDFSTGWPA